MKEQLDKYLEAILKDYVGWTKPGSSSPPESVLYRAGEIKKFNAGLRYTEGKKYFKVLSGGSVHSFIVKEDGGKFKKGDILKPAGWQAPAKNKARGNIFGEYKIYWTGPQYLRR